VLLAHAYAAGIGVKAALLDKGAARGEVAIDGQVHQRYSRARQVELLHKPVKLASLRALSRLRVSAVRRLESLTPKV